MIYASTEFQDHSSSGSLIIANKMKVKYTLCAAAMLLFYKTYDNIKIASMEVAYF
jgi:hypothetical protein